MTRSAMGALQKVDAGRAHVVPFVDLINDF
jgi:hypothetical protein